MTILNANPLTLNAVGQCTAWISDATSVREIVKDWLGNLIWDQVTAIGYGSSLSQSQGASLIGFIQSGTGAVARTMQSKGRDVVSVKDFGAVGDGVTDDTAAIQAAIAACISTGVDSHLHFPRGGYNIGATLNPQFSGIISGAGSQDTIIYTTSATADLFSTVGSYGCLTIRDLQINTTVTRTAGAAILVNTATPSTASQARFRMDNVAIYAQYIGANILNSAYWDITNSWFYNCIQYSVYSDNSSNFDAGDNNITGNLFTAANITCEHVRLINNARVSNNKMLGGLTGIHVEPSAVTGTRVDFQIHGNSLENQWTNGIQLKVNAAGVGIANSMIYGNQVAAMNASAQCISINGPVGGLLISSNLCVLSASSTAGIVCIGNGFGASGTVIINDNMVTGGPATSTGIYCDSTLAIIDNNLVQGATTPYTIGNAGITVRNTPFTFATLPTCANGSVVYCSDGTIANPVAGGGTGCIAKRLNGVWVGN